MTRNAKLIALAGVMLLVIGAYFVVDRLAPAADGGDTTAPEAETVLAVPAGQVTGLTLARGGEAVVLLRGEGDSWAWEGDAAFPLNQSLVAAMLAQLEAVSASQIIRDVPGLEDYGLADPALAVTAQTAEAAYTLEFGTTGSFTDGGYYACLNGDHSTVYVLEAGLHDALDCGLYDLPVMDTVPFISDGKSLMITTPEAGSLTAERVDDGTTVCFTPYYNWFMRQGGDYIPLSTEKVNALLSTLSGVSWEACVAYNATGDALAAYGLDSPAGIAVAYGDGQRYSLWLGQADDGLYYAQPEGSTMVYRVETQRAEQLLQAGYASLRPDDVFPVDWTLATALEITQDGETRRIEIGQNEAGQRAYTYNGLALDRDSVSSLLSQLRDLTGTGVDDTADGEAVALTVTCYLDHPDYPSVTLRLVAHDGAYLAALEGDDWLAVVQETVDALLGQIEAVFAAS